MKTIVGLLLLLLVWEISALLLGSSFILPTPIETFKALIHELVRIETFHAFLSTAWKGFFVLGLVVLLGTIIGLVMGINTAIYEILRPVVMIVQAVPVISWLALVIFLWGIGWKGPVLISFFSLLPISIFTTAAGVRSIDKDLLEMVKVYKVPKRKVFKDIYLGSIVPFVVATIDISIGNVWKVILVSEFLCGGEGLGVLISWARQYVDVPRVYALTIIAVAFGIISERLTRRFVRRLTRKWGMS